MSRGTILLECPFNFGTNSSVDCVCHNLYNSCSIFLSILLRSFVCLGPAVFCSSWMDFAANSTFLAFHSIASMVSDPWNWLQYTSLDCCHWYPSVSPSFLNCIFIFDFWPCLQLSFYFLLSFLHQQGNWQFHAVLFCLVLLVCRRPNFFSTSFSV